LVLLGHNGAGKSTLIKYMLGLYPDIKSHPYLPNLANSSLQFNKNDIVGFAPESPALDDGCSAKDYINWLSTLRGANNFDEIANELGFNVDKNMCIGNYSKGMKQLLSLCLAFFGNTTKIILDEPTSGLDLFVSERVQEFILQKSKNIDLIIATHSLHFAFKLNMETWILKQGKILSKKYYNDFEELEKDFWAAKP
jgi:ABC-2 type transport system ATP-binding protein